MPRIARGASLNGFFHVLNRGNQRQRLFRRREDFVLFRYLLAQSVEKFPVELWGYCLMSNHWHLVVSVRRIEDLSRWMHWLSNCHVRQFHCQNRTLGGGHLYQGRYKSFPVEDTPHLHTVLRYVEANPLRARLVKQAQDWEWSSLAKPPTGKAAMLWPKLARWPRDTRWQAAVNAPLEVTRLDLLRRSVIRGTPFGSAEWVQKSILESGLESTVRPRGRPRKLPLATASP